MKKIYFVASFLATITLHSFAQDSAKANQLSELLNSYYGVKNALVSSDVTVAAINAGELVKRIDGIDMKTLSEADHNAFMSVQYKLKEDAHAIAASNKIENQRTFFSTLSDNIYTLAKAAKLSNEPVYQQYCPMKKMYWLSKESTIKNPYYGTVMLSCGKVTETLK